jgi:hypothetical protein
MNEIRHLRLVMLNFSPHTDFSSLSSTMTPGSLARRQLQCTKVPSTCRSWVDRQFGHLPSSSNQHHHVIQRDSDVISFACHPSKLIARFSKLTLFPTPVSSLSTASLVRLVRSRNRAQRFDHHHQRPFERGDLIQPPWTMVPSAHFGAARVRDSSLTTKTLSFPSPKTV